MILIHFHIEVLHIFEMDLFQLLLLDYPERLRYLLHARPLVYYTKESIVSTFWNHKESMVYMITYVLYTLR